ncbi:MAG: class I SAM-dependent methyltransferase [Gaiellaceae bacterium]
MSSSELPDDARRNRELWTRINAEYTGGAARRQWSREEITWGTWHVPERELNVLPELDGLDVIELGCGTAYFAASLARHGARTVGVDVTPAQLETARQCQEEFGLDFPLIEASADSVPLPDASFDLAVSEYGASIWCDPYLWIPEAARLLRPGGRLVFLTNSVLVMLCTDEEEEPAGERLLRDQFGMHRFEWADDGSVEFHLGHGELIRLLRAQEFEIEDLVELQAPANAETHPYYGSVTADWARRWPSEEIWKARKRA